MALKIKNLYKSFGEKKVFEDFSYSFTDNGLYALLGNSGIGKTTLLRIIGGLDKKYRGEIIGGGVKNVSFVFQEYRLFPRLSAIENAVIPNGDMSDELLVSKASALLMRLGFTSDELSLLPDELSGGMKQRVAIVRALLRDTPILLLDEPSKELDLRLKEALYNVVKEESDKRLAIIVTHDVSDLENLSATRITL